MTTQHPAEKQMAEQKKQDKIREAEIAKRETRQQNAAAREQARAGDTSGPVTTASRSAAVPGGHVTSGSVESHPIGTETRTSRLATAHNPYSGTCNLAGHVTGGGYT